MADLGEGSARGLPGVRPDLEALVGYHSAQVDVDVRLNTNESPLPPPDGWLDALADAVRGIEFNRYPEREATGLRRALAGSHGVGIDEVFCANGSNEVLQCLLLAYGGPGRTAALFEPTYTLHRHIARITGTTVVAGARRDDFALDLDVVAAVVERCPSGALSYSRPDGTEFEAIPASNSIVVANNGPLYARGDLAIEGAPENAPGLRTRAALCRCGRSANKPFCDNSHEAAEFRDRGPIGDVGEQLAAQGGPLSIRALANGPLLVEGNLTLTSGHGLPTWSGTRVALCRCGESANKPFCDGTHALVGFKSDEDAASGATG